MYCGWTSPTSLVHPVFEAIIEKNTIALLSNRFAPKDASSADWLGRHSPKESIRRSGLWNLN